MKFTEVYCSNNYNNLFVQYLLKYVYTYKDNSSSKKVKYLVLKQYASILNTEMEID